MGRRRDWTLEQQLLSGRTINENGCWLWRQQSGGSYGKLTYYYKTVNVHRAAAKVYLGLNLDNDSILVLHKCPNKHCFNPEHLYLGTQSDNIKDSVRDKTHAKSRLTCCPQGHEYTEENTYWYNHDGWTARYCRICMKQKNDRTNKRKQDERRTSNGRQRYNSTL